MEGCASHINFQGSVIHFLCFSYLVVCGINGYLYLYNSKMDKVEYFHISEKCFRVCLRVRIHKISFDSNIIFLIIRMNIYLSQQTNLVYKSVLVQISIIKNTLLFPFSRQTTNEQE